MLEQLSKGAAFYFKPKTKQMSKKTERLDPNIYTKDGRLRRRKPKTKRDYFTQETEDAIIKYIKSNSYEERENIYNNEIRSSMEKLVECVTNSFSSDYVKAEAINILDVQKEMLSHLVNILSGDKGVSEKGGYRQSKGKAYSYFTRTAKNYLIWVNKQAYKNVQTKADIQEVDEDSRIRRRDIELEGDNHFVEFVHSFKNYLLQNIDDLYPEPSDKAVVTVFCKILDNASNLDIFNRKVLYFQIREETGVKTPDITRVLNQVKEDMANQLTIYHLKDGELDIEYNNIFETKYY